MKINTRSSRKHASSPFIIWNARVRSNILRLDQGNSFSVPRLACPRFPGTLLPLPSPSSPPGSNRSLHLYSSCNVDLLSRFRCSWVDVGAADGRLNLLPPPLPTTSPPQDCYHINAGAAAKEEEVWRMIGVPLVATLVTTSSLCHLA